LVSFKLSIEVKLGEDVGMFLKEIVELGLEIRKALFQAY